MTRPNVLKMLRCSVPTSSKYFSRMRTHRRSRVLLTVCGQTLSHWFKTGYRRFLKSTRLHNATGRCLKLTCQSCLQTICLIRDRGSVDEWIRRIRVTKGRDDTSTGECKRSGGETESYEWMLVEGSEAGQGCMWKEDMCTSALSGRHLERLAEHPLYLTDRSNPTLVVIIIIRHGVSCSTSPQNRHKHIHRQCSPTAPNTRELQIG